MPSCPDSARIAAWCAWQMLCAIASPSPVPLPVWDGRAGVVHRQNRLAARCGQPQGHGAAGARVLDGIIQQDHRQPMQGGGIPLHGLTGVRPLQSGYSPANLLRLSSVYRYSIPQSAENRLKKCGRFCACRIFAAKSAKFRSGFTLLPRSLRQPLHGRGGYPWRSFQSCGGLPLRSCPCA